MQLVSHTLFRSHILGPIGAAAAAADDADEDAVLTESPDRGAADDITIASKPLSLRRYQCKSQPLRLCSSKREGKMSNANAVQVSIAEQAFRAWSE